jgi:hypothetical protein
MPYAEVMEKTEYDPQDVWVYGQNNQIKDRFKAVFKIVSPAENDALVERVISGEDVGMLVLEVTAKILDFGIPADMPDLEAIKNVVNKDSSYANAIWGSFQSLMSRNFDQTRHSKKRK